MQELEKRKNLVLEFKVLYFIFELFVKSLISCMKYGLAKMRSFALLTSYSVNLKIVYSKFFQNKSFMMCSSSLKGIKLFYCLLLKALTE